MRISKKILDNIFGGEKEDNDETGGAEKAVGEVLLQRGAGRHHQTIHTVLQHQHMYFQSGFMQRKIRRAFKTKTSPQAKRHKPSLLITSLTILTSLAFITR